MLTRRVNIPVGNQHVAIPLILLLFAPCVLCCCSCFAYYLMDTTLHEVGLLPTYTPYFTRTRTATPTSEGTSEILVWTTTPTPLVLPAATQKIAVVTRTPALAAATPGPAPTRTPTRPIPAATVTRTPAPTAIPLTLAPTALSPSPTQAGAAPIPPTLAPIKRESQTPMEFAITLVTDTVITLVGIFVGMLAALALDRRNERRRKQKRATIVLRSLLQELSDNHSTLQSAKPAYTSTPWGRSFYLSTIAWDTALSSGDLPDVIGFEMADAISAQYALIVRIRYYVDLLTRLWFAPQTIQGYEDIRGGFNRAIVETMNQAITRYPQIAKQIKQTLKEEYE